jgi:aromatic ring-cleaving dioxygenase
MGWIHLAQNTDNCMVHVNTKTKIQGQKGRRFWLGETLVVSL